mmetsp:Transcript_6591/g.19569  ORF Transcript_6591/g.19569 Transcript_6591/m.19569 type:complete len:241 (+) Transcript_6591:256-978(+)
MRDHLCLTVVTRTPPSHICIKPKLWLWSWRFRIAQRLRNRRGNRQCMWIRTGTERTGSLSRPLVAHFGGYRHGRNIYDGKCRATLVMTFVTHVCRSYVVLRGALEADFSSAALSTLQEQDAETVSDLGGRLRGPGGGRARCRRAPCTRGSGCGCAHAQVVRPQADGVAPLGYHKLRGGGVGGGAPVTHWCACPARALRPPSMTTPSSELRCSSTTTAPSTARVRTHSKGSWRQAGEGQGI